MSIVAKRMADFEIISLEERPQWAETCGAWSYAEWGSQTEIRSLEEVLRGYKKVVSQGQLPATWMAVCNDKPAGMVRLKNQDHPVRTDLSPWLASVFVHPAHRGKGIAWALCTHAQEQAKKVYGFKKLYLFTHTAQKLYERLGWEALGLVEDITGARKEGDTLMVKII